MGEIAIINNQSLMTYSPNGEGLKGLNTIELCIKSDAPTIGAMERALGEKKILAYIKVWIINLQEAINPKRQMTPVQIDECATFILSDFKRLNPADINLVFTNAKKGKYGELYESLNMMKIYSWFEVYYNQRLETASQMSIKESQGHKYRAERSGETSLRDKIKNG